jgi:3-phytase
MNTVALCAIALSLGLSGCASSGGGRVARPSPVAHSHPAPINEVQDAAFWIHPTEPARSLVLVTNEHRGLEVHNLDGVLLKHLDEGIEPQYVDVLYSVATASGRRDLVFASCQGDLSMGVKVWAVDPEKSKLISLEKQGVMPVFGGAAPLGLFGYRSREGRAFLFLTTGEGDVEQHEVVPAVVGEGVELKLCRTFKLGGKSKGGVADADYGEVYFEVDKVGVFRFRADPGAGAEGELVIRAGENGLMPNVRGPALYRDTKGGGYLLVGGQGKKGDAAVIHVYERRPPYRHLLRIEPDAGAFGVPEHASGLDITSANTSSNFKGGVLALNDQQNENGSEDFKLYAWRDIARQGRLEWRGGLSPREDWQPTTQDRK